MEPLGGTAVGINTEWIDKSVDPGDDFFLYANGAWYNSTEIPADRSSIGAGSIAYDRTEQRIAETIAEAGRGDAGDKGAAGIVRTFLDAYRDRDAIDRAGLKPVRRDLQRFAAVDTVTDLSKVLGQQLRADVDPLNMTDYQTENLFGLFVTQALTGEEVTPYLLQGGLGLPGRDYYLSSGPSIAALRSPYRNYIAQVLKLARVPNARERAAAVYDLETAIAQAHVPRERSEDFLQGATLWSRAELAENAPGIDWEAFLAAAGLSETQRISAYHADAITGLSQLVASQPIEVWRDWLIFHQLSTHADVLPEAFGKAHFAFYGKRLNGEEARAPLDKRAIRTVGDLFPDAVGKLYADRYFSKAERRDIEIMVRRVRTAFEQDVRKADWLTDATRREALKKIDGIEVGIGFPDKYAGYGGPDLAGRSAYAMTILAERARYRQQIAKIGKPFDRSEWWISPHAVNALNLPVQNALNFPAAILQPPFYDPTSDPAANYGAIGAVIGHEIVHSFDNSGSEFDATGAMRNWWSDEDRKIFDERADKLAEQFSAYRPFPDVAVNGRLTLGENIADLAGLRAAYSAYRASLNGKGPPVIDGYTGDQRFFIAYAQAWAEKTRDAALRRRLATGMHAPDRYRALTVRNLDAWYRAFDVSEDDDLYLPPEERLSIW